jgi:hypothetical protein
MAVRKDAHLYHKSTDLPDMPTWIIHVLAGIAAFVLLIAVGLLLAQFPHPVHQFEEWVGCRGKKGYAKVEQHETAHGDDKLGLSTSRMECTQPQLRRKGNIRRQSNLSIDTGVRHSGSGIAMPGDDGGIELGTFDGNEERDSVDLSSRKRQDSGWLTAPLPSVSSFFNSPSPRKLRRSRCTDIEESPCLSPPSNSAALRRQDPPATAVLRKINRRMYFAAEKMSRVFHDVVNEPEEGLLLPLRESERERESVEDRLLVGEV